MYDTKNARVQFTSTLLPSFALFFFLKFQPNKNQNALMLLLLIPIQPKPPPPARLIESNPTYNRPQYSYIPPFPQPHMCSAQQQPPPPNHHPCCPPPPRPCGARTTRAPLAMRLAAISLSGTTSSDSSCGLLGSFTWVPWFVVGLGGCICGCGCGGWVERFGSVRQGCR
jgi:hypothetical protein